MIKLTERTIFTLVFLIIAALIFYVTVDLGPVARLVPLRVAIVTLSLICFQLLLDLFSGLTERNNDSEKSQRFKIEQRKPQSPNFTMVGKKNPNFQRELGVFLWILMVPTFIYLFGFLIAAPLYTFVSFKLRSKESWLVSIAATIGLWSMLYGLFQIWLNTRLEEGTLWQWLL